MTHDPTAYLDEARARIRRWSASLSQAGYRRTSPQPGGLREVEPRRRPAVRRRGEVDEQAVEAVKRMWRESREEGGGR